MIIDGTEHEDGVIDCAECWAECTPCSCGGLIHHQFIDESYDSVIICHRCDKCQEDYSEWELEQIEART